MCPDDASPNKHFTCYIDAMNSPTLRKGVWCYVLGRRAPVTGSVPDPDSTLSVYQTYFHAIIQLVLNMPSNSSAVVNVSNPLSLNHLTGKNRINNHFIHDLNNELTEIIKENKLTLSYRLSRKHLNVAFRHLSKHKTELMSSAFQRFA